MEYRTSDIILAACLRLNGCNMESIDVVGNKGTFVFHNVSDEFIEDYDLGRITVEPVAFNNMIKQLTTSVRRIINKN